MGEQDFKFWIFPPKWLLWQQRPPFSKMAARASYQPMREQLASPPFSKMAARANDQPIGELRLWRNWWRVLFTFVPWLALFMPMNEAQSTKWLTKMATYVIDGGFWLTFVPWLALFMPMNEAQSTKWLSKMATYVIDGGFWLYLCTLTSVIYAYEWGPIHKMDIQDGGIRNSWRVLLTYVPWLASFMAPNKAPFQI